jgi:hypothetical protein
VEVVLEDDFKDLVVRDILFVFMLLSVVDVVVITSGYLVDTLEFFIIDNDGLLRDGTM